MKRLILIITVIILICGLFVGILESIDWQTYRPQLAQQLSHQLGAKVQLRGELSISFFPFPRLAAEDAEFESPGVYIRAPSLRLAMQFWPLLTGDVVVSRAEIINPEIRLAPEKWPTSVPESEVESGNVQLQDLTVRNGYVRLQIGKHQEIFRSINLKLTAPDWHGPYQASGNFLRDDMAWKFNSVMGVLTATGTRPLEMTLTKAGDEMEIKWQGAFAPSPLMLAGDGLVQWQHTPSVIWAGEMNLKNDVVEIQRGAVAAGDSELGTVTGKYDIAASRWTDLSADLHNILPHFLAQMPGADRWYSWLKGQRILALSFNWQDNAYKNFRLNTAILDMTKEKEDWLIKGRNAAAMFAEMTDSNAQDWPAALSAPFMVRVSGTSNQIKIKDLDFDRMSVNGTLANQKLSLRADSVLWEHWLNSHAPWRDLLLQNGIRELNVKIDNLDVSPFALASGEMNLLLNEDADQIAWRAGNFQINGSWQNNAFNGKLSCRGKVSVWPLVENSCLVADITGDGETWHFTQPKDLPAGANSFTGDMNFRQNSWQAAAQALGGKITANGKIGNDDWRLALDNMSLQEFLSSRLLGAPRGDGKISTKLLVINNSARGDLTAQALDLSALNLSATDKLATNLEIQKQNLRQVGKIENLKSVLKWQNNMMWFENLQTEGPVGYGKAKIDLDKKEWAAEWQGSGARVTLDGPVASAYAETGESVLDQKRK